MKKKKRKKKKGKAENSPIKTKREIKILKKKA